MVPFAAFGGRLRHRFQCREQPGAGNPALAERIARDAAQERIADQGPVPLALVTTSGSGLDPQLPPQAARYQALRVATARGLPLRLVEDLVEGHTERPLVGPAVVNVLALNMALAGLKR